MLITVITLKYSGGNLTLVGNKDHDEVIASDAMRIDSGMSRRDIFTRCELMLTPLQKHFTDADVHDLMAIVDKMID